MFCGTLDLIAGIGLKYVTIKDPVEDLGMELVEIDYVEMGSSAGWEI